MSASNKIRLANLDNLTDVQSCACSAYSHYVERMGREPAPMQADFASHIRQGQVHVAFRGEAFGGYVVFYPKEGNIHLENVAVVPALFGNGIGKTLMEYVEQSARTDGFSTVELYTNEAMTENLAIYPKLGYIETARKQQDGFNRVFFRKLV